MQILIKVGNKHVKTDNKFYTEYRAGIVLRLQPSGYYKQRKVRRNFCIIDTQHDYDTLYGTTNRKILTTPGKELKKYHYPKVNGRLPWDRGYDDTIKAPRTRDWYVDLDYLLDQGWITKSQHDAIFDHDRDPGMIYIDRNLDDYIWHEDDGEKKRKEDLAGTPIKNQGITSGNYTIGDDPADDYPSWADFRDDVNSGGTMTGDLTGNFEDDETDIADGTALDVITNGHTLTMKPGTDKGFATGAVWDATKARIVYGTYDTIKFEGTGMADVVLQGLQLDITGEGNTGIILNDIDGLKIIRNICAGGATTRYGFRLQSPTNSGTRLIANNLIYGIGNGAGDYGLQVDHDTGTGVVHVVNNTVVKCYDNIVQDSASMNGTLVTKNNLCQGDTGGADYRNDGAGFGTTAFNVSEDASSPDGGTYQFNAHDGTSCFNNYASDDYTLVSAGDEITTLDNATDPSLGFTDDIIGTTRSTWYIGCFEIDDAPTLTEKTVSGSETPDGAVARKYSGGRTSGGNI